MNARPTKICPVYSETPRGRREQFRGRKLTFFRKAFELGDNCDAHCWAVVEYNGKWFVYNSREDGSFPPSWDDLVNDAYPVPEVLGPQNFVSTKKERRGHKRARNSSESSESSKSSESSGSTEVSEVCDHWEAIEENQPRKNRVQDETKANQAGSSRISLCHPKNLPLPELELSPLQTRPPWPLNKKVNAQDGRTALTFAELASSSL